jgi:DNA-binding LacI/PurR family transcriptional regulator
VRNERIDLITSAIKDAGLDCELVEVPDYGAANAANALRRQPNACGWVCLSDEISVGVLQLLEGRGDTSARRRILGFDDSPLAAEYRISSFTQHLADIGEHVVAAFAAHFRGESQQFGEREIPVELVSR